MPSSPCPLAASAQPRRGMACANCCGNPWSVAMVMSGLGACLGQGRLPAQVMQHGSPVQGDGQTQGVGELLGQGQRRLAAGHRLVGVPEEPEGRASAIAATHPRVVPAVERGMGAVPLRIIEPQPLFLVRPGGGQLAASEQGGPQGVVGLEQEVRVLEALGQAEELLSQRPHRLIFAARVIHHPESPQHAEELRRLPHLLTQLAGAGVQPFHLWGATGPWWPATPCRGSSARPAPAGCARGSLAGW